MQFQSRWRRFDKTTRTTYEIELARFQPAIEKTLPPAKKTRPDPSDRYYPANLFIAGRITFIRTAAFPGTDVAADTTVVARKTTSVLERDSRVQEKR